MTLHTDILIIGGGISGLLTARELRLAGREVTIIDKSQAGRESSWAGGGILLPLYPWRQAQAIADLAVSSLRLYPVLQRELLEATGIDPEWRDCGLLICKNPDVDIATQWCRRHGVVCQPAPAARLATVLTLPQQALWLPEIAQIRNPRLLKSLQAYLTQLGVKLIENTSITRIETANRLITGINTPSGRYSARHIAVCAGAWTAEFLRALLPQAETLQPLDIQPVKGQMLLFAAEPDTLPHMVLDGDAYLIPRRDGNILAGSTVETAGFDKTPQTQPKTSSINLQRRCCRR